MESFLIEWAVLAVFGLIVFLFHVKVVIGNCKHRADLEKVMDMQRKLQRKTGRNMLERVFCSAVITGDYLSVVSIYRKIKAQEVKE